jgi:hypothetical protein
LCVALFSGTGAGSAWYHLEPNDATPAGTGADDGISRACPRSRNASATASRGSRLVVFLLGIASVAYWRLTGDSRSMTLQFGGIGAVAVMALRPRDDRSRWWIIGGYALACRGRDLPSKARNGTIKPR